VVIYYCLEIVKIISVPSSQSLHTITNKKNHVIYLLLEYGRIPLLFVLRYSRAYFGDAVVEDVFYALCIYNFHKGKNMAPFARSVTNAASYLLQISISSGILGMWYFWPTHPHLKFILK